MKTRLMTKLALAAAVVAFGLAAQADYLYWSASDIKSTSDNPLKGTGQYSAYLFATQIDPLSSTMGKNSTITSMDTVLGLLRSSDAQTETGIQNLNSYSKVHGSSPSIWLNTGYSSSDNTASFSDSNYFGHIGNGSDGYSLVSVFAVVFDAASYADAENYMVLTDSDGNAMTKKLTSGWNIGSTTYDFGSQADNKWYKIGTVPEPTSGVLLALGVAALALKRKHAA